MCAYAKKFSPLSDILHYTPPQLHTGKSWYVDFRAYDPAENRMKRKKYMLNRIHKVKERRQRATELIDALSRKLRAGWSPWVDDDDSRNFIRLSEAFEKYEAYVSRQPRYKTQKTYISNLNVLRYYLSRLVVPPEYVYQFNTGLIADFLDYLYLDREVSARTRNNYRNWCSSLAAFFIERQYIQENPVDKIKSLPKEPKKRQPLTRTMLRQLRSYLLEHDKKYLLACMMEYYLFIRPEELSHVKIGHISLKEQSVFIEANVSKNKRDGKVGLNRSIIHLMIDLNIFAHDSDCYLFGHNFRTCHCRGNSEMFRRRWKVIRDRFLWSDVYQFYSLKDSGIRDLANAEGIVIARDQARHTDVSTTNKYLQGRDLPVHEETKTFEGEL